MSTNAEHNYRKINYGAFTMAEGTLPYGGGWAIMATVQAEPGPTRYMWPMINGSVVALADRPTKNEWEAFRVWVAAMVGGDRGALCPDPAPDRLLLGGVAAPIPSRVWC